MKSLARSPDYSARDTLFPTSRFPPPLYVLAERGREASECVLRELGVTNLSLLRLVEANSGEVEGAKFAQWANVRRGRAVALDVPTDVCPSESLCRRTLSDGS